MRRKVAQAVDAGLALQDRLAAVGAVVGDGERLEVAAAVAGEGQRLVERRADERAEAWHS